MSKAFTREVDDAPEVPLPLRSAIPSDSPNYLTPDGEARLRAELYELGEKVDDHPEDSPRLVERQREITDILRTANVLPAPPPPWEQVTFGALVTVRSDHGSTDTYRIVGAPEVDLDRDWISIQSPIGRALMNAKVGDYVSVKLPGGQQELQVMKVTHLVA